MSSRGQVNPFFTPTQIAGCSIWFDAADTNTITTSGASITQWRDKSGNNRNASRTASSATIYSKVGPYVQFNGNAPMDIVNANNIIVSTSFSVFFVEQRLQSSENVMIAAAQLSTNRNMLISYTGATALRFSFYANNLDATVPTYSAGEPPKIIAMTYFKPNRFISVNGTIGNSDNNSADVLDWTSPQLGPTWFGAQYAGRMYEVLIYVPALTPSQIQQVEGYLAWKWGLQANLPANHPYKSSPIPPLLSPLTTLPLTSTNPFFTPIQISNCQLWLDAADTTTLTLNGSNVTRWRDKSGKGFTATNSGSITTTKLNGLNVLNMPQTQMVIQNFSQNVYSTTFFVANAQTAFFILALGNYSSYVFVYNFDLYYFNAGAQNITLRDSVNGSGTPVVPSNTYFLFSIGYGGGSSTSVYNVNGTPRNTVVTGGAAMTDTTLTNTLYINGNQSGSIKDNTLFCELLIYNGALTQAQAQQVEGYLAWKWGLQGSLPANHPYKSSPIPPLLSPPRSLPLIVSKTWQPSQISGLALWLDAADTATVILSGQVITQWRDKSGNGRNATPANSPTYSTNAVNLNGTTQYFTCANASYSPPQIFIVATNQKTTESTLLRKGYSSGSDYEYSIASLNTTSLRWELRVQSGGGGINILPTVSSTQGRNLFGLTYDNTTGVAYYNGSSVGSGTATGPVFSGASLLYLGVVPSAFIGYFQGSFQEFLIYNTPLTNQQRQTVEGYLAWKWGLQRNLPANHPFAKWPPSP